MPGWSGNSQQVWFSLYCVNLTSIYRLSEKEWEELRRRVVWLILRFWVFLLLRSKTPVSLKWTVCETSSDTQHHCGDAAGGSKSWQKESCACADFVLADLWQVGTCVCVTVMLFLVMRAFL